MASDRKEQSLFGSMTAEENVLLPHYHQLSRGFRSRGRERAAFLETAGGRIRLSPMSPGNPADSFSGGNAQKLVVGRWAGELGDTSVLLLDEPTQGVDIGSRHEIYELLREFVSGPERCVIFASSEPEEILALATRVFVLVDGVPREIAPPKTSQKITYCQLPKAVWRSGRNIKVTTLESTTMSPPQATAQGPNSLALPAKSWFFRHQLVHAGRHPWSHGVFFSGDQVFPYRRQPPCGTNQNGPTFIVAVVAAVLLMAGFVDLSVGSTLALAGVCSGLTFLSSGLIPGLLVGIAVGTAIGAINGLLIGWLELSPLVVTLGMLAATRGGVAQYLAPDSLYGFPSDVNILGNGSIFGVSYLGLAALLVIGAACSP